MKGLRIAASWVALAAILACGGNDNEEDTPPPVGTGTTATPGTPTPGTPTPGTPTPGTPAVVAPGTAAGSQRIFSLRPGFMPDPATSTGTAGGPFEARTRDQACRGWIGAVPSHTLNLSSAFNNLRVVVNSAQDTTLVIQLANGQYLCDDDGGEGMNPMVQGAFPAGMHRVYVGSYARATQVPYTIGISELSSVTASSLGAPPGAAPGAPPTGAQPPPSTATALTTLSPGFMPDPNTATGVAGGPTQGSSFDPNCRGHLPAMPQHTLMLQSDFRNLRIVVNSAADTTLVVRAPDGTYRCNDDSSGNGLNPMVDGAFAPGAYQVWVGHYQANSTAPYTIGFSELTSVNSASLAR